MNTAIIPYTPDKDYTCYPRLVPGDWFYEKLKIENPRKLKRLMKEEQKLYRETSTLEYHRQMCMADFLATLSIEGMKKTGEWQKLLEEGQRLLALRGETDLTSNRILLGLGDVQESLTKRDVKNAYRRMARKLHPDKGGDPEAFKVMYAAYRKLLTFANE